MQIPKSTKEVIGSFILIIICHIVYLLFSKSIINFANDFLNFCMKLLNLK